jgi:hypothetical protein
MTLTHMRMKLKALSAFLRPNPPDMSMETLKFVSSTPQGLDKLAAILSGETKKLVAMDRSMRCADAIAIIECGGT